VTRVWVGLHQNRGSINGGDGNISPLHFIRDPTSLLSDGYHGFFLGGGGQSHRLMTLTFHLHPMSKVMKDWSCISKKAKVCNGL
jgi:hypothetical protein